MQNNDSNDTTVAGEDRLITSFSQLRLETKRLFQSASKKIQIYSGDLDPRILNNAEISDIISQFVRSSRFVKVELLIKNERYLQSLDHCLVRLAQKFSSYIQIKVIPKDYHENLFAFYLIDQRHLLYRTNAERFESERLSPPHFKIREKAKYFDQVWQVASPASQLRLLNI